MAAQQPLPAAAAATSTFTVAPQSAAQAADAAGPADAGAGEGAGAVVDGFTSKQAEKIVGISYRQLDHWARIGLVKPSVAQAAGSGSRRRYSYNDLVELKIANKMREQNVELKSIARAFDYLRNQMGGEVASANIVISGSDVLLADDETVMSLLRQGQTAMLSVLPVAGVRRELDTAVVKLLPDEPIAVQLSLDIDDAEPS
ncbi:MerR family transcriptional regulator [Candidatus Poriferisodalis sp.]|uniref:MerR family transcriptional regulator n=1 Tax=Candidatus Poriferisodalis sp. TaxID=3101277 RepID=UPI003B02DACB